MRSTGDAIGGARTGPDNGASTSARTGAQLTGFSTAVGLCLALIVVVLAAALRLWRIRQSFELFIDEVTYTEIAMNVALGQGVVLHGEPFFLHPPAMFGSLALAMARTGTDADLAALSFALRPVPAVIGAFTPGIVAFIMHRVTRSLLVGAGAGLLLALEPFLIRFDSRVLLEAQAMACAAAGFAFLVILQDRERRGRSALWAALLGGVFLLASLLTKETYASVAVLPVLALLITGYALRRRTSALVLGTVLAGYLAYVLALVFAGQGGEWFAQKTRGVRRLLGLTQITGFNQEGSVGLVDRILANLANFAVTYGLIGLGLLATAWLLLRLHRNEIPSEQRNNVVLLVTWSLGATFHLAYAVTLGTLEEQMFYLLVVTAAPVVFMAAHLLLQPLEGTAAHRLPGSPPRRWLGVGLVVCLVTAAVIDLAVWWRIHTTPDDGYAQFFTWAATALPRGTTLAVTEETTQFVLTQVRVGRWETGAELRTNRADYVLVVSELVRQGYSDVDNEFLRIADQGPVVFRAQSRSLGELTVHDIRLATSS